MNIYIFKGDADHSAHGTAAVLAHDVDEARRLLAAKTTDQVLLVRYVNMDRNPKAQVLTHYFE